MTLSAEGLNGVKVMYELARRYEDGPVGIKDIALSQGIAGKKLQKSLLPLRELGLVNSSAGVRGGYRLNRPPAGISVGEIIIALEGPVAPVSCVSEGSGYEPGCERRDRCSALRVWQKLRDSVNLVLGPVTLADLCDHTIEIEKIPTILQWTMRLMV